MTKVYVNCMRFQFKRHIIEELKSWRISKDRKPLLLMGARQVGKTTVIKEFGQMKESGKRMFDKLVYFDFEKSPELQQIFEKTKDPYRIINSLNLLNDEKITPKTLIVFDEIQQCRDALTALKYFYEDAPEYMVIAAGSYLGVTLGHGHSFPVGKVDFMNLYPLTFSEFLQSYDPKLYKAYTHFLEADEIEPIPDIFFNPISERFKEYIVCGGMPEVASTYVETSDYREIAKIKDNIIRSYENDLNKHADKTTATKIRYVWNSLPTQLAKENKKFIYGLAKRGARARELEEAINWLKDSRLVAKISRVQIPKLPIRAYADLSIFKLYLLDVGLLVRMSDLDPKTYMIGSKLFTEFKGSLTENYVAQSLTAIQQKPLYYWESKGKAEIDFLLNNNNAILPLEVKSGNSTKSKSLSVYKQKYNPNLRVRLSIKNVTLDDDLVNIPLFYTDHVTRFIEKAYNLIR